MGLLNLGYFNFFRFLGVDQASKDIRLVKDTMFLEMTRRCRRQPNITLGEFLDGFGNILDTQCIEHFKGDKNRRRVAYDSALNQLGLGECDTEKNSMKIRDYLDTNKPGRRAA